MPSELPQVVKSAQLVLQEIERAVARFPRYHRYAIGADLRQDARLVARLAMKAWNEKANRTPLIEQLSEAIDDLKLDMVTSQGVRCFAGLAHYDHVAGFIRNLGRQVGGWKKKQKTGSGQNPAAIGLPERPQILSAPTASSEANP